MGYERTDLEPVSHRARQAGLRRRRLWRARRLRQAAGAPGDRRQLQFLRRQAGTDPESIKRWHNSCGEEAWSGVAIIKRLADSCRGKGVPVIYTTGVRRADHWDDGGWAWKNSRTAEEAPHAKSNLDGNAIVPDIAPGPKDIVILKQKPSGFFGTSLQSYLTLLGCDSVLVTGTTTSGCVRATVIDAFSANFRVTVVEDGCFDRSQASHAINLCDMHAKYADIVGSDDALAYIRGLKPGMFDLPKGATSGLSTAAE